MKFRRLAIGSANAPREICLTELPCRSGGKTALILNSRQSKTVCGGDEWVRQTLEAIKYAGSKGYTLITSVGLIIWELQVFFCSRYGFKQLIVCPAESTENQKEIISSLIDDFNLKSEEVGFVFFPTGRARSPKSSWPIRDELLFALADTIFPVSLRPGGNLERRLKSAAGKEIIRRHQIPYQPGGKTASASETDFDNDFRPVENWNHIAHWTHKFHSPWPNENRFDFYLRISGSRSYPSTAFDTLCNILDCKTICGSTQNQNERQKAVAFSARPPQEMLSLMTWRSRYNRLNFEPFAIAVKRSAARRMGIRPVIYGPRSLYRRLSENDRPYFQNEGAASGGNWKPEQEWRFVGDLPLADFSPEELLIITATAKQAELIDSRFGLPVHHLFGARRTL